MISPITAKQLRVDLRENVAEVIIVKMDGTPRQLKVTLLPRFLPENYAPPEETNNDLLVVWDVEDKGWKSFHEKQVVSCQIINW